MTYPEALHHALAMGEHPKDAVRVAARAAAVSDDEVDPNVHAPVGAKDDE